MSYLDLLVEFYEQLDLTKLRIQRPSPFIFLCGGPVDFDTPPSASFKSLRDLVWRSGQRIKCRFVLAESAQELFTHSHYDDLVEFEAHIAQISDLVLLICESPGSLAELGAFASEPAIANRLYVLVHADHHAKPSFIMLGPLRKLRHLYPDSVGKWEWRMHGNAVDTSSISIDDLEDEINFKVGEKAKWAVEANERRAFARRSFGSLVTSVGFGPRRRDGVRRPRFPQCIAVKVSDTPKASFAA